MFAWQVDTGHRATINLGYDLNGKIGMIFLFANNKCFLAELFCSIYIHEVSELMFLTS